MFLEITYTSDNADNFGYILRKNPNNAQKVIKTLYGYVKVFFPVVEKNKQKVCLIVNPDFIKTESDKSSFIGDEKFIAGSILAHSINTVFSTALTGHSKDTATNLSIRVLPVRASENDIRNFFEPLGWSVECEAVALDEDNEWLDNRHYIVKLSGNLTVKDALSHLVIGLDILDNNKYNYINEEDIERLKRIGQWISEHPDAEYIVKRYLRIPNLVYAGLNALGISVEKKKRLHDTRIDEAVKILEKCYARNIVDIGCGEGLLEKKIVSNSKFRKIVGIDPSLKSLKHAKDKLDIKNMKRSMRERIDFYQGSILYPDKRYAEFDTAVLLEVIEHIDPWQFSLMEQNIFRSGFNNILITTPNKEWNQTTENPNELRHKDHRFEWTRKEFQDWGEHIKNKFGYNPELHFIGEHHDDFGAPTQAILFRK